MKIILRLIKPYWLHLILSLSFKSIAALADLFLPWVIAYMIDETIPSLRLQAEPNLNELYILGVIMIGIAFFGWILNVYANRKAEWIAAMSTETLRNDLFSKIETLSANQVDQFTRPSLISRTTTDTYNIYRATAVMQRMGVRAPVLLFGGIIMSLLLDPVLTLVMISLLPFMTVIIYVTSKKGIPLYKNTQKSVDKYIRTLRETITGARVIRALSTTDIETKKFDRDNLETVENEQLATITMAKINPMMQAIMNIGLVVVLVIGAYRISIGMTKIGQIMAFVTYFTLILNAMMSITRIFVLNSRATASGARIDEILDAPFDFEDGTRAVEKDLTHPHIVFEDVSFSYNKKGYQLEDISFSLKQGQTLGVIGATGSGKTTLIYCLMRFYELDKGRIKLYGRDINEIKSEQLRRSIGVVFQNDLIFADSIFSNIQMHRKDITEESIKKAMTIAQAEFIYEKTDDLKHVMAQRGLNLSGGQKQRILIARALAGKPDIIILDDASSALDYQTDLNMRKTLRKELSDSTMIIITQRISSIKDADLILILDEGRIVGRGTHQSLMNSSKLYQEIASYQMGGDRT
ncbi:MAG: ABC transporter ATP-binding protein [Acholeplasmataceae bacterium]